ncbi:MAG TPA: TlpA disulfide reductase family protein [Nannocystis sp.]
MIRRGLTLLLRLVPACVLACARPQPSPAPPPAPAEPLAPAAPIRHAAGEILDLTVPLAGGGGLSLRDLRGRVVVLELTSAALPSWPATFAFYNDLLRHHGADRLAVIVVAVDPERAPLSPEPELRRHGFELGWDPQGALAARLQVAAFPTVLVLDQAGRIVLASAGQPRDDDAVADAVRALLAAPPPPGTPG